MNNATMKRELTTVQFQVVSHFKVVNVQTV